MKTLTFIFMFFLCAFASDFLDIRTINLRDLDFEFFPCEVKYPIIKLKSVALKKYSDDVIVIVHDGVKYHWRNKMVFSGEKEFRVL